VGVSLGVRVGVSVGGIVQVSVGVSVGMVAVGVGMFGSIVSDGTKVAVAGPGNVGEGVRVAQGGT
jgi:hypothetical protein